MDTSTTTTRDDRVRRQPSDFGLWSWAIHQDWVYVSPAWNRMVGRTQEICDAHPWLALVHPKDCDALLEAIAVHLGGEQPRVDLVCRIVHRDGAYRRVQVLASAHRDARVPQRLTGIHMVAGRSVLADARLQKAVHIFDTYAARRFALLTQSAPMRATNLARPALVHA